MVAILRDGLRIMPHSGGRVGRGIYSASENAKSAGYVGTAMDQGKNIGLMFLNEVILGTEHHIKQDDSSLISGKFSVFLLPLPFIQIQTLLVFFV